MPAARTFPTPAERTYATAELVLLTHKLMRTDGFPPRLRHKDWKWVMNVTNTACALTTAADNYKAHMVPHPSMGSEVLRLCVIAFPPGLEEEDSADEDPTGMD
jgi:hypothetical protein